MSAKEWGCLPKVRIIMALTALTLGCTDPQSPDLTTGKPGLAKATAGSGPSVTSTAPSYGDQGTINLDVHVLGSGFDRGSRASWEKDGVPYTKITVNSTTFESSSDLLANITIASDATLDFYDVAVYTTTGKKGIGTELFEVTAALPLPDAGHARGINDAGQVVGGESASLGAFLWDPAFGTTHVSDYAFAWDIDEAGGTLVGSKSPKSGPVAYYPVFWTRTGTEWQMQDLPALGSTGQARALASDPSSGAAAIAVGWAVQASRRSSITLPVKWTRLADGTWTITALDPAGSGGGSAWAVNPLGMAAGTGSDATGTNRPLVWDAAGNVTALAPVAVGVGAQGLGISKDGSVVVGSSNNRAMMWTRNPDGSWNPAPVDLDLASGVSSCPPNWGDGRATAINSAGVIVGQSCSIAYAWRVSGRSVLARIRLGGLGTTNDGKSWATAINDASPATAAGKASGSAVIWRGL